MRTMGKRKNLVRTNNKTKGNDFLLFQGCTCTPISKVWGLAKTLPANALQRMHEKRSPRAPIYSHANLGTGCWSALPPFRGEA
ncbi:MAG: hypothetical protein CM1200mP24_04510 [Gammaproteobacteria bacterium]|nr:MAG: hypothetical protein CM1200mP24_04510 [Gammaproteobacteria bacterium]